MHKAPSACTEREWVDLLHGIYPVGEVKAMRRLWLDLATESEVEAPLEENCTHTSWTRLMQGEPIQYVLGKAYFMGTAMSIGPGVLIPRPETEELVDWVLGDPLVKNGSESESGSNVATFLDLGTGSGCIALALAKHRSFSKVIALDCEEQALHITQRNAVAWGLTSRLQVHRADFMAKDWKAPKARFWISNPPYIGSDEVAEMDNHVIDYEPHVALFAPGTHPLEVYYTLIGAFLEAPCSECFWLELNPRYAEDIVNQERWGDQPHLEWTLRKDMQGKRRMLRIRKKSSGLHENSLTVDLS